jgi:hypothetical protein
MMELVERFLSDAWTTPVGSALMATVAATRGTVTILGSWKVLANQITPKNKLFFNLFLNVKIPKEKNG